MPHNSKSEQRRGFDAAIAGLATVTVLLLMITVCTVLALFWLRWGALE
jgi:hypothetical protein